MNTGRRALITVALFGCLFGGSVVVVKAGIYGWTVFVAIPLCLGGLTAFAFQPKSEMAAFLWGAYAGAISSCLFLAMGIEGLMCVFMALLPLCLLSAVGSWIVYRCFNPEDKWPTAMALLLPLSFGYDINATPPVYSVSTSIIVSASPERVWKYAVAFPEIPDLKDWIFRTGLAYPKQTRIVGTGPGAARYCDLSTGPVVETVTTWDEPRLLGFRVVSTPPAMEETGLYGRINPKHLTGYFVSKQGQFALTALPDGRTLLEGTSWYQHGLWPAEYWRLWSDMIVHHIHARVLEHIRLLSENRASGQLYPGTRLPSPVHHEHRQLIDYYNNRRSGANCGLRFFLPDGCISKTHSLGTPANIQTTQTALPCT